MNMAKKDNMSSGMMGALLGAAAGAAAVFFSNKDNRDMVRRKINVMKEEGQEKAKELKDEVDEAKEKGSKKLARNLRKTASKVEDKT